MIYKGIVTGNDNGRRLDDTVSALFQGVSKSEARRIIDRGGCAVNGTMVRVASRAVKTGDLIETGVMEPGRFAELVLSDADLLYEDKELVAVNKPAGVNTQRTPYQLKGTLEYWVSEYFRQQGIKEPARVIHRLDRGTSGVMVFPKHRQAAAWLSKRFHDGEIHKRYLAIAAGLPEQDTWRVTGAIGKVGSAQYGIMTGGRPAVTEFSRLAAADRHCLVEARPLTGRTHQIRVHLASCGLPIMGDGTYGGEQAERMMLHCAGLAFKNTGGIEIDIKAPPDAPFQALLQQLGLSCS